MRENNFLTKEEISTKIINRGGFVREPWEHQES
jgi:hypothetical protein